MFRFSWLALVAAIVCLYMSVEIQGVPIGDKADELKIASAMDIEGELKTSTESPKNEPTTDDPTDHIQVIKMDITPGDVKEIEELEKEIVEEFHLDEKSEVVQLLPCIHDHEHEHDHMKMDGDDGKAKDEMKTETTKMEDVVTPKEPSAQVAKKAEEPVAAERSERDTLTDEDITKIMHMISFPQTADDATNKKAEPETAKATEVEPRTVPADEPSDAKTRVGRAIRNDEGRGYLILAFEPIEGPVVPSYTKLDIIPVERSANGSTDDDYDAVEEEDRLQTASDDDDDDTEDEARFITSKQLSRYIRRMMKQIRKGTRKIQRKTRFKSANEEEPTVENFLRKVYETGKEQQIAAPKNGWFSWSEK